MEVSPKLVPPIARFYLSWEIRLSLSNEGLIRMENLSPPDIIIYSPTDETFSSSGETFYLLRRDSIEPLGKTCYQVSQARYMLRLLGVTLEFCLTQGETKSLSKGFN